MTKIIVGIIVTAAFGAIPVTVDVIPARHITISGTGCFERLIDGGVVDMTEQQYAALSQKNARPVIQAWCGTKFDIQERQPKIGDYWDTPEGTKYYFDPDKNESINLDITKGEFTVSKPLYELLTPVAEAAISIGNTANSGVLAAVTSTTFAIDNNKEDVIVSVTIRDTRTADTATATYAGAAMTSDRSDLYTDGDTSIDLRTYIFRKTSASTGSNNVVVTFSGSVDHAGAYALAAAGLSATGQPDVTNSASADATAGTDPSVTFTTTVADTLLIDAVYNKSGTDLVAATGQTIVAQLGVNAGGDTALAGYEILSASGSQTSTYTETVDDDWLITSVAYAAATAVAASTPTVQINGQVNLNGQMSI